MLLRNPGTGPASRWIFFAALLLTAVQLAAAEQPRNQPRDQPWDGPAFAATPADVVRAAAAIVPNDQEDEEGVTVLLSETFYTYDEAGRETYTQRLVYKIGSAPAHESWSAVEEAFSPWRQETPRLRARVITPDALNKNKSCRPRERNGTFACSAGTLLKV